MVSELKECGEKVKGVDVAYTILMGLKERFSPLVVTLTNMSSVENPLSVARVCEQILTEELRLQYLGKSEVAQHADNPLAFKSDTMFRGDLQHTMIQNAFVARTAPHQYRQSPYPSYTMRWWFYPG